MKISNYNEDKSIKRELVIGEKNPFLCENSNVSKNNTLQIMIVGIAVNAVKQRYGNQEYRRRVQTDQSINSNEKVMQFLNNIALIAIILPSL